MSLHDNSIFNIFILLVIIIFKGTLKDALDRYSLYGLEENSSYDCNFKSEIEDIIKLVSILFSVSILWKLVTGDNFKAIFFILLLFFHQMALKSPLKILFRRIDAAEKFFFRK